LTHVGNIEGALVVFNREWFAFEARVGAGPQTEGTATTLEEVVITGSALPTSLDTAATSVSILSADKIAQAGVTSKALEILRKELPAFSGSSNTGNSNVGNGTNQITAGGSQAQLRNLDTLVLVNGRRVAVSAVAGISSKSFLDTSWIPTAAIDRIEVLADGASAIYGSEAVGGVVNFILKTNFDGVDVTGQYGGADGGYSEQSAHPTRHRFGAHTSIVLTASVNHDSPLYPRDRAFSNPYFVTSAAVPGAVGNNLLSLKSVAQPLAEPGMVCCGGAKARPGGRR
jgi:iron complex outermembrane receptor protein